MSTSDQHYDPPGDLRSFTATLEDVGATVMALRDYAVSLEPSHQDDLDYLIEQLHEIESNAYLRAIASDPTKTCESLNVHCGKVGAATVSALAKGELEDRHRASDRSFTWWHMLIATAVTGVIGIVVGLILGPSGQ